MASNQQRLLGWLSDFRRDEEKMAVLRQAQVAGEDINAPLYPDRPLLSVMTEGLRQSRHDTFHEVLRQGANPLLGNALARAIVAEEHDLFPLDETNMIAYAMVRRAVEEDFRDEQGHGVLFHLSQRDMSQKVVDLMAFALEVGAPVELPADLNWVQALVKQPMFTTAMQSRSGADAFKHAENAWHALAMLARNQVALAPDPMGAIQQVIAEGYTPPADPGFMPDLEAHILHQSTPAPVAPARRGPRL